MSKLVRMAHCQRESVLTCLSSTHGGDWHHWEEEGTKKRGGSTDRGREGGGGRGTKKLHVSTWCWQLMRCTIIIFNQRSTALWRGAGHNNSSSSARRLPAAAATAFKAASQERRTLKESSGEVLRWAPPMLALDYCLLFKSSHTITVNRSERGLSSDCIK